MTTNTTRRSAMAFGILACAGLWGPLSAQDARTQSVKRIGGDPQTGIAQAVIVEEGTLAYTAQFSAIDESGKIIVKDASSQVELVFDNLSAALRRKDSDLDRAVKLNVYAANVEVADVVRKSLARRFATGQTPAVSFVQTRLPHPDALVAMDAVGLSSKNGTGTAGSSRSPDGVPSTSRLSAGHVGTVGNLLPRIYVSGQAEKGMNLAEATAKTLAALNTTLEHLDLSTDNVVQVKCFLSPMSEVQQAKEAIAAFFTAASKRQRPPSLQRLGIQSAPPCVFVEWESSLPIEIELLVAGRSRRPLQEPLEFITPPGITASPVFCRVVRVNDPRTIFISGLHAKDAADSAGEVTQVFEQLQDILKASGSDLRHLAKATYYVSNSDVSAKLNELRPKYYDPQRPPAASKAQVFGVGVANRSLTLDMIAVPTK